MRIAYYPTGFYRIRRALIHNWQMGKEIIIKGTLPETKEEKLEIHCLLTFLGPLLALLIQKITSWFFEDLCYFN